MSMQPTQGQPDEHARGAGGTGAAPEWSAHDLGVRGGGWVSFAAIMLAFAGVFTLISGIVALGDASFYVANAHYVFSNLRTWGWIMTIVGVVQLIAAGAVVTGSEWARWVGIVIAGLNAIAQLAWIQAYPFWAICMFAVDVLVIYGLSMYGGAKLRRQLQ